MSRVDELLARRYVGGTTVTNCVMHMDRPITERSHACNLCMTDVTNTLSRAIRMNEWLNEWKDDAEKVLAAVPVPATAETNE